MVTIIAVIVVILVAALGAYVATRPNAFCIVRSASIKAPPDKIFPLINNLHDFNIWNPFAKQDTNLKLIYSGGDAGKGAAYEWEGKKTGIGRMEIIDEQRPTRVSMKLDFKKPFEAHNLVDFTMVAKGDETLVSWNMHGPMTLVSKILGLFMSMDKMIGGEFEKGLANLKALAEK